MAFTAITNNIDWQAASFVNEFIKAWNERVVDMEQSPFATAPIDVRTTAPSGKEWQFKEIVPGDDIQTVNLWKNLQQNLIDAFNNGTGYYWTNRYLPDPGITITTFDDFYLDILDTEHVDPLGGYYTQWELHLLNNSGIDNRGFRRATTIPTDWTDYDDAAYSYGVMEVGDIIGPWIFQDLQAVFKNMTVFGVDKGVRSGSVYGEFKHPNLYAPWTGAKTSWPPGDAEEWFEYNTYTGFYEWKGKFTIDDPYLGGYPYYSAYRSRTYLTSFWHNWEVAKGLVNNSDESKLYLRGSIPDDLTFRASLDAWTAYWDARGTDLIQDEYKLINTMAINNSGVPYFYFPAATTAIEEATVSDRVDGWAVKHPHIYIISPSNYEYV